MPGSIAEPVGDRSPGDWLAAYERFAARKTASALSAPLPPYATDLTQPPLNFVGIGNDWTRREFDGPFYLAPGASDRPACSLVFVQSADGNTGATDPSTLGGGQVDAHVIYEGLSRVAAHGVLAGAETIRGGQLILSVWHPELIALRLSRGLPRHPIQIVATLNGLDLRDGLMFNLPDLPVLLLTTVPVASVMAEALPARPWIELVPMADPNDLPHAFARLRRREVERLSCIGGRTLASALLDAHLVDDVYLTTSPTPGGTPDTPMYRKPWRGEVVVRKRGTASERGVVFEHVRVDGVSSELRRPRAGA
jgi:5-amino-6-(5-phosphoribosylamino)uracil reductase